MSRISLILVVLIFMLLGYGCKGSRNPEEEIISDLPDFEQLESQMEEKRTQEISASTSEITDDSEENGETSTTEIAGDTTDTTADVAQGTEETQTESVVQNNTTTKSQSAAQGQTTTKEQTTTKNQTTTEEQTTTKEQVTTTTAPLVTAKNGALKEFSVTSLDGKTYTQDVFTKADVNVVILWTTWCGYCKLEMPVLQQVMEKYSGQSVQFFSVCKDAVSDYYKSYAGELIDKMGVTFPCLAYNDSMSDGYVESIAGYPTTLYLNSQGEIMFEVVGSYAARGDEYGVNAHSSYLEFCLNNPDYVK